MRVTRCVALAATLLLVLVLAGCGGVSPKNAPARPATATDYSDRARWLALPASPEKAVDVFYLYPTSWSKAAPSDPDICAIDDPSMLGAAPQWLASQASVFQPVGNIYAPYYRQADAAYLLSQPLPERDRILRGAPAMDVTAAFEYYIEHYNNGRPFILAGHSQGAGVLTCLLADYMQAHPDVYKRMIAAYAIGTPVTAEYLGRNPHLKFAKGRGDTGVVISYDVEAPSVEGPSPFRQPGALTINPISWIRGGGKVDASHSLGSLLFDGQGGLETLRHYADARVDKCLGVVICSTADVGRLSPGNTLIPRGALHTVDYSLYYYDLRANAALRAKNYLAKQ